MFYVGQKVCCVDASESCGLLEQDKIYTVIYFPKFKDMIGVDCEPDDLGNTGWFAKRFRPIADTKAEVSFTIGADPDSDKWDNRKVKVK